MCIWWTSPVTGYLLGCDPNYSCYTYCEKEVELRGSSCSLPVSLAGLGDIAR